MKLNKFVFALGGSGLRVVLAKHHVLTSRAYKDSFETDCKIVYEMMDGGSSEIKEVLHALTLDKESFFHDPNYCFEFVKLSEDIKRRLQKSQDLLLRDILPDWFLNKLLLTEEELDRTLHGGYFRDLTLGSFVSSVAVQCGLGTEADKKAGFTAVIDSVVNSQNSETRVAMVGSLFGGEGRLNLCTYPAILKELCVEKVMEVYSLDRSSALTYVEDHLKIALIGIGAAFRFPENPESKENLNQDISGLVSGTLKNYSKESANAVNLFYFLEHDFCPVQAEKEASHGEQYKHAHAIELVAVSAIEDFFQRETERVSKKQCPVFPYYSLPKPIGKQMTNWENLALPLHYRKELSARLRFDAALFQWLAPELNLTPEERSSGKLYESDFLGRMFNSGSNPKKLKKRIEKADYIVDDKIINPLKALLLKETYFLRYLSDVSQTGRHWNNTDSNARSEYGTDLFNLKMIDDLLKGEVDDSGHMKSYRLDDLTKCGEGNLYHTDLTLDKLRTKITYHHRNEPRAFSEILDDIYELCSKNH